MVFHMTVAAEMTSLETLAAGVGQLLQGRGMTIAVAESCTGGHFADQLTNVPGASGWFVGGVVAYSNAVKTLWLGVPEELLQRHGAVSAEVAGAMAEGVRRSAGTTLGLAVTGIAGPSGGTPAKPVGTVYIALAAAAKTEVTHHCIQRDRREFKIIVGITALDYVRRYCLSR
ncbi:MAG: nicotinamide-nucleotide amidohydrolase family protein [Deltaproteobacteria bacterium]|nr:nicotinamide-nucleotide amidohydrolase family protein [Deltaproteobacteria bacterium]